MFFVLMTMITHVWADVGYDYYEFSIETAEANDGDITGKAVTLTRSAENSEDLAIEFEVSVISISENTIWENTTEKHNYVSIGGIYHPTVFSGFDLFLGGYFTIVDFGVNNPEQESYTGFRTGFRYAATNSIEIASYAEKIDIKDTEPATLVLEFGYQVDKQNSIKLGYSTSSGQDSSDSGLGISYVYYLK